ncbi:MAG: WXG100 family type VII secretion target [Actinomyces graevenitzii]|nr:WXG100 family type VII secretion target [Actinomyces graevenitzii]
MASVGADVEQLRTLAQLFGDKATSLEDVVSSINGQLHSAGWVGEDADTFKADWDSNLTALVRNVVDSLRERNTSLNQQADEQEKASAVNGAAGGAKAVGGAAKAANGGSGSDPYNGKPREGEEGRDADYARLAQAAYEEGDPIPDGWRKVDAEELKKLGIDPSELDTANGMQATIYQNADGKYVLAFRGTEPSRQPALDIANDIEGGVSTSPQVLEAINLSTKLAKAVGRENVDFTGHSLGGELASAGALATGGKAVTFNAAGLSVTSETIARANCINNFGFNAQAPMDGSNVKAYCYAYDPLNGGQDIAHSNTITDFIAPRAYGERHIIPASEGSDPLDFGYNHEMARLYGALDAQYENPSANHIAASGRPTTTVAIGNVGTGIANGIGEVGNGIANGVNDVGSGFNDAGQHFNSGIDRAGQAWNRGDYVSAATETAAGTAQAVGDVAVGAVKGTGDVLVGTVKGTGEAIHGLKKAIFGGE